LFFFFLLQQTYLPPPVPHHFLFEEEEEKKKQKQKQKQTLFSASRCDQAEESPLLGDIPHLESIYIGVICWTISRRHVSHVVGIDRIPNRLMHYADTLRSITISKCKILSLGYWLKLLAACMSLRYLSFQRASFPCESHLIFRSASPPPLIFFFFFVCDGLTLFHSKPI
jgi:hypothetical protein